MLRHCRMLSVRMIAFASLTESNQYRIPQLHWPQKCVYSLQHEFHSHGARFSDHPQKLLDSSQREFFASFTGGAINLSKNTESGIATITLNNPEIKNAVTGKMMVDLHDIVQELSNWREGKGIILHGADHTFCSGGDLNFVRHILSSAEGHKMSHLMHNTLNNLFNLPMISVAVLEGIAIGGGAEIATACDFILMANTAKIGFIHAKINVAPGFGAVARLSQKIGRGKALDVLSHPRILKATEAVDIGLADGMLTDSGDLLSQAEAWLQKRICHEPTVVHAIKSMIVNATDITSDIINREIDLFGTVWGQKSHRDAVLNSKKHND